MAAIYYDSPTYAIHQCSRVLNESNFDQLQSFCIYLFFRELQNLCDWQVNLNFSFPHPMKTHPMVITESDFIFSTSL